jgi:hypothetical protein
VTTTPLGNCSINNKSTLDPRMPLAPTPKALLVPAPRSCFQPKPRSCPLARPAGVPQSHSLTPRRGCRFGLPGTGSVDWFRYRAYDAAHAVLRHPSGDRPGKEFNSIANFAWRARPYSAPDTFRQGSGERRQGHIQVSGRNENGNPVRT